MDPAGRKDWAYMLFFFTPLSSCYNQFRIFDTFVAPVLTITRVAVLCVENAYNFVFIEMFRQTR